MMIDRHDVQQVIVVEKKFGLEISLFRVMTASICVKTPLLLVFLSFGYLNHLILHNMITLTGLNDFLAETYTFHKFFILLISNFYAKFGF